MPNLLRTACRTYCVQTNCHALANMWKEKGFKKVGSLAANGEYSELCVMGVKDVYPDATIEYFNSGDETRTQLLRLARSGIEAVTLTGFEVDFINTFNAREVEHLTDLHVGCVSAILTPNVRSQYPQGLKNIWRMEFPFVTKEFALQVKSKDSEAVVSNYESAAIAYTAVHALYDGFEKCGKKDPECVMKALPDKPVEAPLPFLGFKDRKAVYPPIIKYYETLAKE